MNNTQSDYEQMKESERQIAMGWKRGRDFGLVSGILGTVAVVILIRLILLI